MGLIASPLHRLDLPALIDLAHRPEIAALPRLVQFRAKPRRDIGGHRDATVTALSEVTDGGRVLSGEKAEARALRLLERVAP